MTSEDFSGGSAVSENTQPTDLNEYRNVLLNREAEYDSLAGEIGSANDGISDSVGFGWGESASAFPDPTSSSAFPDPTKSAYTPSVPTGSMSTTDTSAQDMSAYKEVSANMETPVYKETSSYKETSAAAYNPASAAPYTPFSSVQTPVNKPAQPYLYGMPQTYPQGTQVRFVPPKKKSNKALVIVIILVCVALSIAGYIAQNSIIDAFLGERFYTKQLMTFNDAIVENDFGKYVSCYSPKIAAMFTSEDFALDRSYYIDKMGSQNFKIEITSSDAYTFDDVGVSDIEYCFRQIYGESITFDDVYYVEAECTLSAKDGSNDYDYQETYIIYKIKGKWYLDFSVAYAIAEYYEFYDYGEEPEQTTAIPVII